MIAAVIFVIAHLALLVGMTTPEKFYFDEVHYVPAARQMLEPVMPSPMLNPMHPPLAKQLIALSIRIFGDVPLGWRYPGVLFGSLAIVAMYLCGLALFSAQGPAIADGLLAFFNQMVFVQSRIAMLDIFALAFGLLAIAAFMHGFRQVAAASLVRARRPRIRSFGRLQMERTVSACRLHRDRRRDPPDARLAHAVRRRQGRRLVPARPVARFQIHSFRRMLRADSGGRLSRDLRPLYGLSLPDLLEAQRRIFGDNTTTAIAGHTYMSSWPSWPFLVRPVWYLFEKAAEDRIAAVVFLGNPLVLWAALPALAVCLRDWIVTRRADAFLILSFYVGPYLAWALLPRTLGFLYYYLPAATFASLALVYVLRRGNSPRWLLWAFVAVAGAGFAAMLPITVASVGTSMETFVRLMLFQSWI